MREHLQEILFFGVLAAFFGWRFLAFRRVKARLPALLEAGALLVDVRSPGEFASGHHPDSVNVPLDELPALSRDWDRDRAVVLCCASGTRSGMAAGMLRRSGIRNVFNAGPWRNTLVAKKSREPGAGGRE